MAHEADGKMCAGRSHRRTVLKVFPNAKCPACEVRYESILDVTRDKSVGKSIEIR